MDSTSSNVFPSLVFIAETKPAGKRASLIKERLDFSGASVLIVWARAEVLWDEKMEVDVKIFSSQHVDVWVINQDSSLWRFTGVYGFSDSASRHHTFGLLKRLSGLFSLPWLMGDDFNEVMYAFEKDGGSDRRFVSMARFRQVVDNCGLIDLGFQGEPFTWKNGQEDDAFIQGRIDRFFGDSQWINHHPNC